MRDGSVPLALVVKFSLRFLVWVDMASSRWSLVESLSNLSRWRGFQLYGYMKDANGSFDQFLGED